MARPGHRDLRSHCAGLALAPCRLGRKTSGCRGVKAGMGTRWKVPAQVHVMGS